MYVIYRYPTIGGRKYFLTQVYYDTRMVVWTPSIDKAMKLGHEAAMRVIAEYLDGCNAFIESC